MSMTDPIANFLSLIKSASKAKKEKVDCPYSNIKERIAQILKKKGYIKNFKKIADNKQGILRIYLKYGAGKENKPAITDIRRVSKPGLRIYKKSDDLKPVFGGIGIAIVSTSKGIMADKECKDTGVGGEVLCKVW